MPKKFTLPIHEIERICKAFIRLILAQETTPHSHEERRRLSETNDNPKNQEPPGS